MAALDSELERVKTESTVNNNGKIGRRSKSAEPSSRRSRRRSVGRTNTNKIGNHEKSPSVRQKRRSKSASPKLQCRKRNENRDKLREKKLPSIEMTKSVDHDTSRNKRRRQRRASTGSSAGSLTHEVQSRDEKFAQSANKDYLGPKRGHRRRRRASTGSADGTEMMKAVRPEIQIHHTSRRKAKMLRRASTGSFDSSEEDLQTVAPSRSSPEKTKNQKHARRQRRASTGTATASARTLSQSPTSRREMLTLGKSREGRRSRSRSRTREQKQSGVRRRHGSKSRSRSRSRAKERSVERTPLTNNASFEHAMVDPPRSPRPSRNPRLNRNRYLYGGVPRSRRASIGCSYEAASRVEAKIRHTRRHSTSHQSKDCSASSSKERSDSHWRASKSLGNYDPDDFSQISLARGKNNGPVVDIPVLIEKGLVISFSESKAARLLLSGSKREALCKPATMFWSRRPRAISRCIKVLRKRQRRKAIPLIQRWYRGCRARLVHSSMMGAVELLFSSRFLTQRNRRRFISMAVSVVATIQRYWRGFWARYQVNRIKAKGGRSVRFVRLPPPSGRAQTSAEPKTILNKTETINLQGLGMGRWGDRVEHSFHAEDEASDIESGLSSLASNNTNSSPRNKSYSLSVFPPSPGLSGSAAEDGLAEKLSAWINPIQLSTEKDKMYWWNEIQNRNNHIGSFVATTS